MRYWDSSAIVPLILRQDRSNDMDRLLAKDSSVITWWGTPVECQSALMRLLREGTLSAKALTEAEARLGALRQVWDEVLPSVACQRTAERILRSHPLRAGDALQLAAAIIAVDHDPTRLELVSLDARLATAARIEGFRVFD